MSWYNISFAVQTNIDLDPISGSLAPQDYSWNIDNGNPLDEYDDKIIVWGAIDSASWGWSSIPEYNQIHITGSLLDKVFEDVNISASQFIDFHMLQIEDMEVLDNDNLSITGSYSACDTGSTGGVYYMRYFIDGVNVENNCTSLQ
jgi:hypothetical protein